jgi:hypothetical protein
MLSVGSDGTGYDARAAIATFLRTVQGDEPTLAEEAKQLLRALRPTDRVVPVVVRAALLGFRLEEPVPLAFGQLFPGHAQQSGAVRRIAAGTASERFSTPSSTREAPSEELGVICGRPTRGSRPSSYLAEAADEPLSRHASVTL